MTKPFMHAALAASLFVTAHLTTLNAAFAQREQAQTATSRTTPQQQRTAGAILQQRTAHTIITSSSSGVGVGSEACRSPAYAMDQRCLSN